MIALSSEKKKLGIGLMSGTSLDGLDIAACYYEENIDKYQYKVIEVTTVNYSETWKNRLQSAENLSGRALQELHIDFARFCANEVNKFLKQHNLKPDFISSHGHTVFHQPQLGYTLQIGCGATIAAITGVTTIADFRQTDVAHGGQGAPLVPIGDLLLFNEYEVCINLGGFANISVKENGNMLAYDICPVNIVLNDLCKRINLPYDDQGIIAKNAKLNLNLLEELNNLGFYKQKPPKSLGAEWVRNKFTSIINQFENEMLVQDIIATITAHAAIQIANAIPSKTRNVLITGGGAHNTFLINSIQEKTRAQVHVPELNVINYKEAIIFGLIGLLRLNNKINILKTVTGAKKDSCSGLIHF